MMSVPMTSVEQPTVTPAASYGHAATNSLLNDATGAMAFFVRHTPVGSVSTPVATGARVCACVRVCARVRVGGGIAIIRTRNTSTRNNIDHGWLVGVVGWFAIH